MPAEHRLLGRSAAAEPAAQRPDRRAAPSSPEARTGRRPSSWRATSSTWPCRPTRCRAMVFRLFAHLAFGDGAARVRPGGPLRAGQPRPPRVGDHAGRPVRDLRLRPAAKAAELGPPLAHHEARAASDERPAASSALLTGADPVPGGRHGIEVQVSYPNLALRTADGHRALVISHGHFTESIYTLMSRLRDILYPGQRQGPATTSSASRRRTSPGSTSSGPPSAGPARSARTWG